MIFDLIFWARIRSALSAEYFLLSELGVETLPDYSHGIQAYSDLFLGTWVAGWCCLLIGPRTILVSLGCGSVSSVAVHLASYWLSDCLRSWSSRWTILMALPEKVSRLGKLLLLFLDFISTILEKLSRRSFVDKKLLFLGTYLTGLVCCTVSCFIIHASLVWLRTGKLNL